MESVVDGRGFSEWVQAALAHAQVDVAFELIHGGKHELLNEVQRIRDYVITRAKEWFAKYQEPVKAAHSLDQGIHPAQIPSQ